MAEPSTKITADKSIQKLLDNFQQLADEEKIAAPKREAARKKIEELVDDLAGTGTFDESKVSNEMIAAFLIFQETMVQRMMMGDTSAQMAMGRFSDTFMKAFGAYMQTAQADMQKVSKIEAAARVLTKDMAPPKVPTGMTYAVAIDEPEDGYGEWTLSFVALEIDKDYNVKMTETVENDMDIILEVTPANSLSDTFNVPGKRYVAGQKFEPFTVTHETKENDQSTQLQVRGHIYDNGQRVGVIKMNPVALYKFDQPRMDMEAMLRMIANSGPGPNSLN